MAVARRVCHLLKEECERYPRGSSGEECRFAECHDEVKRWRALILTAGDNPGAHAAPAEGFRERIKICAETGAVHVRDGREAMGVQ